MAIQKNDVKASVDTKASNNAKKSLTVEELERRINPATTSKKVPTPPYPPGADYGLVRRDNLSW